MKGPFHRLRYNLTRAWECHVCHHKVSTPGDVTTQMCDCKLKETGRLVSMRLVGDGPRRVQLPFERVAVAAAADSKSGKSQSAESKSQQSTDVAGTSVEMESNAAAGTDAVAGSIATEKPNAPTTSDISHSSNAAKSDSTPDSNAAADGDSAN